MWVEPRRVEPLCWTAACAAPGMESSLRSSLRAPSGLQRDVLCPSWPACSEPEATSHTDMHEQQLVCMHEHRIFCTQHHDTQLPHTAHAATFDMSSGAQASGAQARQSLAPPTPGTNNRSSGTEYCSAAQGHTQKFPVQEGNYGSPILCALTSARSLWQHQDQAAGILLGSTAQMWCGPVLHMCCVASCFHAPVVDRPS
jgi:hypothetical protein